MRAACSAVSMPSATVLIPRDLPIATIAPARAAVFESLSGTWTNSLAILRTSTGNWRRWLSEK